VAHAFEAATGHGSRAPDLATIDSPEG
jgi:hypothetical protein